MKKTVNQHDFIEAFRVMGRENQFSYDGKIALFDYLEQYEEDCDTELELDVIALCCDFMEYSDLEEFQQSYGKDEYPDLESIQDNTTVIELDKGFIIQQF